MYQGQTQAVALGFMGSVPLVESIENMSLGNLIHAGAAVCHCHRHPVRGFAQAQGHNTSFGGKLGGVVQQIHPDLLE